MSGNSYCLYEFVSWLIYNWSVCYPAYANLWIQFWIDIDAKMQIIIIIIMYSVQVGSFLIDAHCTGVEVFAILHYLLVEQQLLEVRWRYLLWPSLKLAVRAYWIYLWVMESRLSDLGNCAMYGPGAWLALAWRDRTADRRAITRLQAHRQHNVHEHESMRCTWCRKLLERLRFRVGIWWAAILQPRSKCCNKYSRISTQ